MLTPEEVEILSCTGKLQFMCCLTKDQYIQLCVWVEGMGPKTRSRFYDTACCGTIAPPSRVATPGAPVCPPDAVTTLCNHFNQEWLEAAAALGTLLATQLETGPLAVFAGIISAAATAVTALCYDKTVTSAAQADLCALLTYGAALVKATEQYPLLQRVLIPMQDPRILTVLAACCSASTAAGGSP